MDESQRKSLPELQEMLEQAKERVLAKAPEHLRELGPILRRSVERGSLVKFRRFLAKHEIEIPRAQQEAFRDYLIIHRIDLKDLEPAARQRLRARTLAAEDPRKMTADYRAAASRGDVPSCRDCRWFVTAPNDGEPGGEKSCVQRGTKGADQACIGFTLPPN